MSLLIYATHKCAGIKALHLNGAREEKF